MIAKTFISQDLTPLRTSDTGDEVLALMGVFSVRHLPIVNNNDFLGLIAEDDIYSSDLTEPIGSYDLSLTKAYVLDDDHIFEIMSKMAEGKLTVIPVIDKDGVYIGSVTQNDILQYYASSLSFSEPGSIIVLEVMRHNYMLSEIARIIEQEGATILGTFLTPVENTDKLYVTLKINKANIQSIISSLQRYDYHIKGSFYEEAYFDGLKENYDALMNYLNV